MAWDENFISALRGFIFLQCPAGHAMACGVLSRHQTDTSWRTNGTGVGVGECDSFTSQLYHGGCLVDFIELRRLGVKRYRGFLPAHVIDEEEEDVGLACEHFGGRTKLGQYRGEQRREERVFMVCLWEIVPLGEIWIREDGTRLSRSLFPSFPISFFPTHSLWRNGVLCLFSITELEYKSKGCFSRAGAFGVLSFAPVLSGDQ